MEEKLNPGWYRDPNYLPAIQLALNAEPGGLEIFDFLYHEETDSWYVELEAINEYHGRRYDVAFRLDGKFVRSCFEATKKGMISWQSKTI